MMGSNETKVAQTLEDTISSMKMRTKQPVWTHKKADKQKHVALPIPLVLKNKVMFYKLVRSNFSRSPNSVYLLE